MSELFHYQAGNHSLRQGYFDAAVRHYETFLRSSTGQNRMVGLFEMGEAFKLNSCFNTAILCYEKILDMPTQGIDPAVADDIRRKVQADMELCDKLRNYTHPLNALFQPRALVIEPTNACNYSCYKCLHPAMKRKKTKLDPEQYEKFLSGWARRFGEFEEITFTGGGEALLHKGLTDIVRSSSKWMPHSCLTIGTNLSLLSEVRARELIEAGLKNWKVSLDTDDRAEHEKITGQDTFEVVIGNIEMLWSVLDEGKRGQLEVAAHRPLDGQYSEKMREIFNLVNGKCTVFRRSPYHSLMGRKENAELKLWEQTMDFDAPLHKVCLELWHNLVVTADGDIRRCCSDMFDCPDAELFGNIFTQTLDEIISNEKRRTVQTKIQTGATSDLYLCNRCFALYDHTSTFKG